MGEDDDGKEVVWRCFVFFLSWTGCVVSSMVLCFDCMGMSVRLYIFVQVDIDDRAAAG